MKFIFALLMLVLSVSCSEPKIQGKWRIDLSLQGKILPVALEIIKQGDELQAYVYNGGEKILLEGVIKEDQFELVFSQSYAKLVGSLNQERLVGHWIRTNKVNFKVPFIGSREEKTDFFSHFKDIHVKESLHGQWKVKLKEDKFGLGNFEQSGSFIRGSILTTTGDYRYLHGYILNGKAFLYGFDGVFSFVFEININQDTFTAQMHSGPSTIREISAMRDEAFALADPKTMTKVTETKPLELKAKSINGTSFDFTQMQDKAKVVQIFGSWCPNCIDETNFILEWKKNNPKAKNVFFVAYAFESTESQKEAIKNLKKLKNKLTIDYPIVLADFDKSKKVTDFFPIDKNRAFPTTLYLNKDNKIIKVHTGFSGQATGIFFEKFKKDFNTTIDSLLK